VVVLQSKEYPALYCPFPPVLNPQALAAEQHTAEFVIKFKLLKTEDSPAYDHFNVSRLSRLVARACPTANFADLAFASDLMAYLFLLDDDCDEDSIGKNPQELKLLFEDLLSIMRQPVQTLPVPTNPDDRTVKWKSALQHIWQQLPTQASPEWQLRFINNLAQSIQANMWEAANRAQHLVPELATYVKMRALTNGFYWCCDLSELIEQIQLPDWIREHAAVQNLGHIATNVTGWFNDIVSLHKEIAHGDVHNLVLVLQHQQNLTLTQALHQAILRHNDKVKAFLDFERQLPSFGSQYDQELTRYLAVMHDWMRSNVDWSLETGRYQIDPAIRIDFGKHETVGIGA
jgi:hypothetical protein